MEASNRKPERRVFVGNLDYHTTSEDLVKVIQDYFLGTVVDVFFPKDKNRKPPKLTKRKRGKKEPVNYGCAFIQLAAESQAEAILDTKLQVLDPYDRPLYFCKAQRGES